MITSGFNEDNNVIHGQHNPSKKVTVTILSIAIAAFAIYIVIEPHISVILRIGVVLASITACIMLIHSLFENITIFPDKIAYYRFGNKPWKVIKFENVEYYTLIQKSDPDKKRTTYWQINIYTRAKRHYISERDYKNVLELYGYLKSHLPLKREPDNFMTEEAKGLLYLGILLCVVSAAGFAILTYLDDKFLNQFYVVPLFGIAVGVFIILNAKFDR